MVVGPEPAAGMLLASKYRLKHPLGSGGMGQVWNAFHESLRVEIAIKFLQAEQTQSAMDRFAREAHISAAVKNPHVVQVLDFGVDQGLAYLVMERLHGQDLHAVLTRGPLSPTETARIVVQVCKALYKAHRAGFVHRDVKPDNIFLCADEDGLVKLLDFGVAGKVGTASVSDDGKHLIGTLPYMSPEQAQGKALDHRSDLFSVGVVAYQGLTGRLPFFGPDLTSIKSAIVNQAPPPVARHRPSLSRELDVFFQTALDKVPDNRHADARAMAEAFELACARSVLARMATPTPTPPAPQVQSPAPIPPAPAVPVGLPAVLSQRVLAPQGSPVHPARLAHPLGTPPIPTLGHSPAPLGVPPPPPPRPTMGSQPGGLVGRLDSPRQPRVSSSVLPDVIAGVYRPLQVLAGSSSKIVYLATPHESPDARIVLEVLIDLAGIKPRLVDVLRRETTASNRITDEGVLRVLDVGTASELGGAPFVVSEFADGGTVATATATQPASLEQTRHWMYRLGVTLISGQDNGLFHLDLRPEKLYLVRAQPELIKLAGLGMARFFEEVSRVMERGVIRTPPRYFSPEQARGHVDHPGAVDGWALGMIAFRMLSGRDYFQGDNIAHVLARIMHEPMVPPSSKGVHAGPAFDAWFLRACHRDLSRRFTTLRDQVQALDHALTRRAP